MKNNRILLAVFMGMVGLAMVSSCNQDENISNSDTEFATELRTSNDVLNPNVSYIHNGITSKNGSQITESETMNVVIGYNGQNYVFDDDALLRNWTFGNSDRTRTRQVLDSINYFKTLENTIDGTYEVEASIIPIGWLYRDLNSGGPAWPIKGWSYGFRNNTASSYLLIFTGAVLCDRDWWGGAKVWLFAIPGNTGNLNGPAVFFNDRANSGWDL